MIQRSKPTITRILTYFTTNYTRDEDTIVENIFCTKPGKHFGQQIDQVIEFSQKGLILTLLPALGNYAQGVLNILTAGSISKTLDNMPTKLPPLEAQFLRDAESLVSRVDISKIVDGFKDLPTKKDRGWYFSFTILAIYAYLDVYSKSIIEFLVKNPLDSRFNFDKMKGTSIIRRLAAVYEKTSIHYILSNFIDTKTLERLQNGFTEFIRIRGKIAHSNPRLNHDEYSFSELERDLKGVEIDYSEIDEFVEKIGFAQYEIAKVKEEIPEIGEVFRKLRLVLRMAVIYPALIDAVLCNLVSIL